MVQYPVLAGLLQDDHMVLKMREAGKAALLAEMARRAARYTGLAEADLRGALTAREALGSTGFGAGAAVPHARIDELTDPFALFVQLSRAIPFDAIDGLPVDLVFVLLSPAASDAAFRSMANRKRFTARSVDEETSTAVTGCPAGGVG